MTRPHNQETFADEMMVLLVTLYVAVIAPEGAKGHRGTWCATQLTTGQKNMSPMDDNHL